MLVNQHKLKPVIELFASFLITNNLCVLAFKPLADVVHRKLNKGEANKLNACEANIDSMASITELG